jgi:hypothetical protein
MCWASQSGAAFCQSYGGSGQNLIPGGRNGRWVRECHSFYDMLEKERWHLLEMDFSPPVVVVVRQVQLPEVNIPQNIRVAHQVRLPVVVEVVPRDGDPVATAHAVELPIVVVRAELLGELGLELVVVDPDAGAVLNGDAVVVDDEADRQVADDDVRGIDDRDAVLADLGRVAHTEDGLVAADAQAGGQVDATLDVDGARRGAGGGCEQGGAVADCDLFAFCSARCLAEGVVLCVADEVEAAELAAGVLLFARDFVCEGECRGQSQAAEEDCGDPHVRGMVTVWMCCGEPTLTGASVVFYTSGISNRKLIFPQRCRRGQYFPSSGPCRKSLISIQDGEMI